MDRSELRRIFRAKRNELSDQETAIDSSLICSRITDLKEYKEAEAVLCYMAFRNEVDNKNIMLTSWASGKKVFLPRIDGMNMEFFLTEGEDTLIMNDLGIMEPAPDSLKLPKLMEEGTKLLMIVPGLVFDKRGYRLGYGGGFYDRYLSENRGRYSIITAAAAFSIQIYDRDLPAEDHDIPVDLIVTENTVIDAGEILKQQYLQNNKEIEI